MGQGDEEYLVQRTRLEEAIRDKDERLTRKYTPEEHREGIESTAAVKTSLFDPNTRILERILETDFRHQDWIERTADKRKTRKNINENYQLLTGQGSLGSKELKDRKEAFEKRRLLSSKASEQVANLIASESEIKTGPEELAKEVEAFDIEDFSFENDEDLVRKFVHNMPRLMRAEHLLRKLDKGENEELRSNDGLYRKLLYLKDIKAAYEERIVIISSPYYVSVKEEDYTEETLQHMKNSWRTGGEIRPEYVDAVLSWHERQKNEHAFKYGVTEADSSYVDMLVKSHREVMDMLSAQNGAGSFIEKYDERVRAEASESGFKHDVSVYSLSEIRDYMESDKRSKSESYCRMERALKDVFRMKNGVSDYGTTSPGNMVADYRDILRYAEFTALEYASKHKKWFHFTSSGDERYKMSVRLSELLRNLRMELNAVITKRIVEPEIEDREEQLEDIDEIIRTGAFTSEEAGKEIKGWLLDNPEYKAVLSRIVKGRPELGGDKEILLKFLEDKNRLLVANNMTLSMVCDEHPELTLKLPALKRMLRSHIEAKLKEKPETQERIYSEVKEFRQFISDCVADFAEKNAALIDSANDRMRYFLENSGADKTDELLRERPEMEDLLLSDYDTEEFKKKVGELIGNRDGNVQIIERLVDQTGWSDLSKKRLRTVLEGKLGGLLFFAGEHEVAVQALQLITASNYVCPAEAEAERRISSAMYVCEVPKELRNVLAGFLASDGQAESIAVMDYEMVVEKTLQFMTGFKYFVSVFDMCDTPRMKLTKKQWEQLTELKLRSGTMKQEQIFEEYKTITGRDAPGLRMSLDSYRTGRTEKPRGLKSIGFTEGILGDRFLETDEVKRILNEEEIAYLKENLMKQFAADDETFAVLENSTGADIARIASIMEKNLSDNAGRVLDLRNDKDLDIIVKRRVILRLVCAGEDSDGDTFARLLAEEKQEFEKKTMLAKEMEEVRELVEGGIPKDSATSLKGSAYKKRLNYLKSYDRGRYALLAPFLMHNPEFYAKSMNLTRREFINFVANEAAARFKDIAGALSSSPAGEVVKRKYLEERFNDIYNGRLSGNVLYFKRDIDAFEKSLFEDKGVDGRSLQQNFDEILNELVKKLKGSKAEIMARSAVIRGVGGIVVKHLSDDEKGFELLKSKQKLKQEIERAIANYDANAVYADRSFNLRLDMPDSPFYGESGHKKTELVRKFGEFVRERMIFDKPEKFEKLFSKYAAEFEKRQTAARQYTALTKLPENYNEIRKEVEDRKDSKKAQDARTKYLGFSEREKKILQEVFVKKALVNVRTGNEIDLSHKSWQTARDHLSERLGYLGEELDPFIIDCLVEKNVTTWYDEAIDRSYGVHFLVRKFIDDGFKRLDEHAKWLVDVKAILSETDKDEEPVSEDELHMMLVNVYRNEDKFLKKDGSREHDHSRRVIKGKWYKEFRENYRELRNVEKMEISYPSLRQEQLGLSRDLRAFLSTGLSIKDQDEKAGTSFKTYALRAGRYLSRVQSLCVLTEDRLGDTPQFEKLTPEEKLLHVEALRAYFNGELMDELSAEKEDTEFNRTAWSRKIDEVLSDPLRMRYMVHSGESTGSEKRYKENRNYTSVTGRGAVDNIIEEFGWPGQRRKYRKLDEEGKEFFALALMLMDKTAIGLEGGTARVLTCRDLEDRQAGLRLLEVKKYLQGEPYDLKVDYLTACEKLVNYGYDFNNEAVTRLSDTAYDKAMEFALGIVNRRYSLNEKDIEKAGDPSAVIIEAGLLGKEQVKEMRSVSEEDWNIDKIRSRLVKYALLDLKKVGEKIGLSEFVPLKEAQAKKEFDRISEVSLRLSKLGKLDLMRLVAVLQNRTALDESTKDTTRVINEDKREELKLMLSDENTDSSLAEFSSPGACLRALLSTLSFKIKDERKLGGDMLAKGDFDSESFDRVGMIDWRLIERALDLIEESRKDNIARYAVRHAADYIERSGNERAAAAYKTFKGKKDLSGDALVDFLKEQAEKDAESGDNAEARIAFGGFMALSPGQKKLFFRALGQRDLLDISKRNLYRNIFRGSAERFYANEVGRCRLIDEYIEKSRDGNEGITLSATAHYDALRSLLSTQVDDTADFNSVTDVRDALAGEKLYIFRRNTAVDWKLFTRALQFVNRASYELNVREGNAELYRSAGELSKYGHMSMDYSVLRRNIHSTGNQFLRFGVQRGLEFAGPDLLKELKLNIFGVEIPVGSVAGTITDLASLVMPEKVSGVIGEIKDVLIDGKTERSGRKMATYAFKPGKENDSADAKFKKQFDSSYNGIDQMRAQIDAVFANAKLMEKSASALGSFINHLIPEPGQILEPLEGSKKKKSTDLLDQETEGYRTEKKYGDIRDAIADLNEKRKTAKKVYGIVKGTPFISDRLEKVVKLTEVRIIESFAQHAAGGTTIPWVQTALEESYEIFKTDKLERLKQTTLKKLIGNGTLPKGYEFTEEDIKSHKYWAVSDEELTDDEKLKAAENAAKTYMTGIIEGMVGPENARKVYEAVVDVKEFTDRLREKMVIAGAVVNLAGVFLESFVDISKRSQHLKLLDDAEQRAEGQGVKDRDRDTLRTAAARQSKEQKALTDWTVEQHIDLEKMADKVSETIQGIEIARDVSGMVIQTGSVAAHLAGADPATVKIVTDAVKAGVDFALYAIRVVKDQNMLADYYRSTDHGVNTVRGILDGAESAFGKEKMNETAAVKEDKVLDIVCAGKGYEKREELVMDTGLRMAASIAFSASNYNPILANKIRAVTCMAVLGLRNRVGKTDAGTISAIFEAMKAA